LRVLAFGTKGVKVSRDLWSQLQGARLIENKKVAISGVLDLGFSLPFFDGDIYVIYDPELDDKQWELPPDA
jgi:hypothetical protein